ncbi:TetR/AcrR family transcriptional regulator [Streptomyces sp. NPDC001530]|uniref:TetR/AcrR family transcriptional regulator n=1 Tax=Streptomyces sp. NPDC001530 TaxID=3364582 RepID=UPI0036B9CE48
MTAHPTPRPSRRERPAKPALTRDGIIETAVALLRAEGLQRVTMRRLAQELDTGPASLYVYVRNTAELHAAVLDDLLGAVDLSPAGEDGDWRERLVRVLDSYTAVMFEYPGLARSALVARPSGEHYLDLLEALLSLLSDGGVPEDLAAWAVDLLLQFATATAAEHAAGDKSPADTEGEWAALAAALRGASDERHPHIAQLGAELLSGPGEARLNWGFHVLINGVLHTPRPRTSTPDAPGTP